MLKKIIQTERLFLREMTMEDKPALDLIMKDEETMRAYEHAFSDEEIIQWLEKELRRYRSEGYGLWAVCLRETGEMIGQCGITIQKIGDGTEVYEVGYLFQKAHWHKGYAIEAARACRDYAFEQLGCSAVYSIIRDTNIASQKVAQRNGMSRGDIFDKYYHNVVMPHYAYSITRAVWAQENNSRASGWR